MKMPVIPDHVARVFPQVSGDYGVGQTAGLMAKLVREGREHYIIRRHTALAVQGASPGNTTGVFVAISHYCRNHFRFVKDSRGIEQLKSPWLMCGEVDRDGYTSGDCDDFAILACSIGDGAGFTVRIATLATGKHGDKIDHARAELLMDSGLWRRIDFTPDAVYDAVRALYWRI